MALGNNKLFEIRIKGINHGSLARNCSPGVTYVVASSMDKAYNAMRLLYGFDTDFTNARDFELDSIKLVADEANPNRCESDTYKLIIADAFFERFFKDKTLDTEALKDFIEGEKEENPPIEPEITEEEEE